MSITTWKLSRNSAVLAQITRFFKDVDQEKVVSKALDGTIYIQTIGRGIKYADVSVFVTLAEKDLVNAAEADGALVSCVYRGTNYLGYIEEHVSWDDVIPGEYYNGTFKLLIDEEVSV